MAHLVVFVPFDLHTGIYGWGPELVTEAVRQNCPDDTAEVVDLRECDFVKAALSRFDKEAMPHLAGLLDALQRVEKSWWGVFSLRRRPWTDPIGGGSETHPGCVSDAAAARS